LFRFSLINGCENLFAHFQRFLTVPGSDTNERREKEHSPGLDIVVRNGVYLLIVEIGVSWNLNLSNPPPVNLCDQIEELSNQFYVDVTIRLSDELRQVMGNVIAMSAQPADQLQISIVNNALLLEPLERCLNRAFVSRENASRIVSANCRPVLIEPARIETAKLVNDAISKRFPCGEIQASRNQV